MIGRMIDYSVMPLCWLIICRYAGIFLTIDDDFKRCEKFLKSIGDIKSHGVLNAVMLNRDLTEKEAIAKIFEISNFVKKHYTTAQYNIEFLKTSAEHISGIRMKELEITKEIYNCNVVTDFFIFQYCGRAAAELIIDYDFYKEICNNDYNVSYEKLAKTIELGNEKRLYGKINFDMYKVINEHHKIEMAFQDADTLCLSEQVNELHARYEELTTVG